MAIGEGGEAAPADDLLIELALVEEELAGGLVERWMLEEAEILLGIESPFGGRRFVGRFVLLQDDVVFVSKPLASLNE